MLLQIARLKANVHRWGRVDFDFLCGVNCTFVSFVYRSVHALSENKLATAQTDEKLLVMEWAVVDLNH